MFVFVPPPPPSDEAIELSEKIEELVRIVKEKRPGLGRNDLRVAMRLAEQKLRGDFGGAGATPGVVVAIVAGLVMALGLGLFMFFRHGGPQELGAAPILVVATLLTVLLALVAIVAAARR